MTDAAPTPPGSGPDPDPVPPPLPAPAPVPAPPPLPPPLPRLGPLQPPLRVRWAGVREERPPAPLPEGNVLVRTFSDLNRVIVTSLEILRASWGTGLRALLVLTPLAFVVLALQGCCAFTVFLGGWSLATAIAYSGPYVVFARALKGRPEPLGPALRVARWKLGWIFLCFAPQSILAVALFIGCIFLGDSFHQFSRDDASLAVFTGLVAVAAVAWLGWLWLSCRIFFLAPIVAIVEEPGGIGAIVKRSYRLSAGRMPLLVVARLLPDLLPVVTVPEWSLLGQTHEASALKDYVSVIAPMLAMLLTVYLGALLTVACYGVATGEKIDVGE